MGDALNALRLIYAIGGRYTSERLGPRPKMRSVAYRMRCVYATAEADCEIISQQHEDTSSEVTSASREKLHIAKTRMLRERARERGESL